MIVLGVSDPRDRDSAAAILVGGHLAGAVEAPRLNADAHPYEPAPAGTIAWCLDQAGCALEDVDAFAVGYDRPRSAGRRFLARLGAHLGGHAGRPVADWADRDRVELVERPLAQAASAFLVSPFEEANVISLDTGGRGAGLLGVGRRSHLEVLEDVDGTRSWGEMYERFTVALGFRPHGDEEKVAGLAAYGDPGDEPFPFIRADNGGLPTYDPRAMLEVLSEIRPRSTDEPPVNGYHEHVAARLQLTLETALARAAEVLHERTGLRNLCLAGGVALNCSSNGRILELPFVDRLFVQPAAPGAATALGAALQVHVERTGRRPEVRLDHAYWGPSYSNDEIERVLRHAKVPYRRSDSIAEDAARLIAEGKVVGWFQGRTELGPRGLGARSILADPRSTTTRDDVSREARVREPWRPFAPSILAERMPEYFGTDHESQFMILAFPGTEVARRTIPAALHVDGSGHPQTVDREANPPFRKLIEAFEALTGVPAVLNTSFNVDGEPAVCSPTDALRTFYASGIDALAIGDFLLEKRTGFDPRSSRPRRGDDRKRTGRPRTSQRVR
ncbi:MAG TPA: carbamoyltransferase C-terminal domain-containing protein [Gaiellaceae bacterium]|nr:carbamoyltransferase C-terminal domain-containing protein [Gaiellaceae bacterium]